MYNIDPLLEGMATEEGKNHLIETMVRNLVDVKPEYVTQALETFRRSGDPIGEEVISRYQITDIVPYPDQHDLGIRGLPDRVATGVRDLANHDRISKLAEENPDLAIQQYVECDMYLEAGALAKRVGRLDHALQLFEEGGVFNQCAILCRELGRHSEAAVFFERYGNWFAALDSAESSGVEERIEFYRSVIEAIRSAGV